MTASVKTFGNTAPTRPGSFKFRRGWFAPLLGTNDIGQDLFSELIWGTRISFTTGLVVAVLAVTVGTGVGIVSGYFGGWGGATLMRLADLTLVLPFLPLVILLSAYLGPSQRNVMLVLTLVSWAGPARLVRAQVLTLLRQPYLEAARALGSSPLRIMTKHIWPGVRIIVLAQGVLVASVSILAEASLSFLGLGDLSAKSWGTRAICGGRRTSSSNNVKRSNAIVTRSGGMSPRLKRPPTTSSSARQRRLPCK